MLSILAIDPLHRLFRVASERGILQPFFAGHWCTLWSISMRTMLSFLLDLRRQIWRWYVQSLGHLGRLLGCTPTLPNQKLYRLGAQRSKSRHHCQSSCPREGHYHAHIWGRICITLDSRSCTSSSSSTRSIRGLHGGGEGGPLLFGPHLHGHLLSSSGQATQLGDQED